jgi:hypothetical protein
VTTERDDLFLRALARGDIVLRDDGEVWRHNSHGNPCEPHRIDRPTVKGYRTVVLGVPGTRRTASMQVHRIAFLARGVPIPAGMQIDHKDGDKGNNRWGNLEVVTQSENMLRSYRAGRRRRSDTRYDVDLAYRLARDGASIDTIAQAVGCSRSHAARLRTKGLTCH